MAYLAKNSIRSIAIALILLTFITTMIEIMLAGIDYKLSIVEWQPFVWRPLPALQMVTIITTFIICILGYVTFTNPTLGFITGYSILLFISIIFNTSVGMFACAASSYGWVNEYFGCQGKFEGITEIYRSIDTYLQVVDQSLCSEWCPCYLNNATGYISNNTINPVYTSWNKTSNSSAPVAFQNCTPQVQESAFEGAASAEAYLTRQGLFSVPNFITYMKSVEEEFQCSGWCNTNYYNWDTGNKTFITKYMFTDVNRGPPVYNGCLNKILMWIPPYLAAWGAVTLTMAVFEMGIFFLCLCQCYSKEIERTRYSTALMEEDENLSVSASVAVSLD